MEISIVVAVDENNGIGYQNRLLCHLPNDLKYFKRVTSGHTILMGRKTFDSIGKPLPNRVNMVLSATQKEIAGCEVFGNFEEARKFAIDKQFPILFIIGGDSIYKQTLAYCHKVYLTRIHHAFEADAFFPALPEQEWKLINAEPQQADEKNAFAHTFEVYERISHLGR